MLLYILLHSSVHNQSQSVEENGQREVGITTYPYYIYVYTRMGCVERDEHSILIEKSIMWSNFWFNFLTIKYICLGV